LFAALSTRSFELQPTDMKRLFLLIALTFSMAFANAQAPVLYNTGLSGTVYSGVTYMNFKGLRTYLNNPEALEHIELPYTLYTQVGGEWMAVSGRWTLGSGATALSSPPFNVDSVDFDVNGWGAYIKLGYHYLQTTKSFAYSYLGLGAGGSSLTITNIGNTVNNKTGFVMPPGKSMSFADGLYFMDAGTGYKIVFSPDASKRISGLTVGIDGGCKIYISSRTTHDEPPMHQEEQPVQTQIADQSTSRTVVVPYVQMTVGFASFGTGDTFRK
jgi:hypothetical protein